MLLQFCDKCGRPLSEGCIARGEAVERDGELICLNCKSAEPAKPAVEATPLGQYQQAVWSCESCGIPVTALDLIEGRASRVGGLLKCSRCAPVARAPAPVVAPAVAASTVSPAPAQSGRKLPRPRAPVPLAKAPASVRAASAESYVADAKAEQRRPIVPIVMFAIVMPMFAVSLYFAITSQVKLNEVMGKQEDPAQTPIEPRQRRPFEKLQPEIPPLNPPVNKEEPPTQPAETPKGPAKKVLPPEVIDELVGVEKDLARPVIAKLQSSDLGVVWEGLIEAGSRRLIAARPYARALLDDRDDQTRALACRVCGMLSDREALMKLTKMAEQDPAEPVRIEARKARDRLTGQATRDLRDLTDAELEEMLSDIQRELERRKGKSD
jgi:hypothetical protein